MLNCPVFVAHSACSGLRINFFFWMWTATWQESVQGASGQSQDPGEPQHRREESPQQASDAAGGVCALVRHAEEERGGGGGGAFWVPRQPTEQENVGWPYGMWWLNCGFMYIGRGEGEGGVHRPYAAVLCVSFQLTGSQDRECSAPLEKWLPSRHTVPCWQHITSGWWSCHHFSIRS